MEAFDKLSCPVCDGPTEVLESSIYEASANWFPDQHLMPWRCKDDDCAIIFYVFEKDVKL